MIQCKSRIIIERPVPEVFEMVGNPLRDPVWHFDVLESGLAGACRANVAVEPGSRFRWMYHYIGQGQAETEVEVKDFQPDRRLRLKTVAGGLVQGIDLRLRPLPPSRTCLTRTLIVCQAGIPGLLENMLRPLVHRRGTQYLAQLRQVLEGGPLDPFFGSSSQVNRRPFVSILPPLND